MARWGAALVAALVVLSLGGCAIYDQTVLPALTGEFYGGEQQQPSVADPSAAGMERLTPQSSAILPAGAVIPTAAGPLAPLAVVRFQTPDVAFEEALQPPIERALAARPEASFRLVAVSPAKDVADPAPLHEATSQRNVERVLAALTKTGVSQDRVIFAATSDEAAAVDEVRVYLLDLTKAP